MNYIIFLKKMQKIVVFEKKLNKNRYLRLDCFVTVLYRT